AGDDIAIEWAVVALGADHIACAGPDFHPAPPVSQPETIHEVGANPITSYDVVGTIQPHTVQAVARDDVALRRVIHAVAIAADPIVVATDQHPLVGIPQH